MVDWKVPIYVIKKGEIVKILRAKGKKGGCGQGWVPTHTKRGPIVKRQGQQGKKGGCGPRVGPNTHAETRPGGGLTTRLMKTFSVGWGHSQISLTTPTNGMFGMWLIGKSVSTSSKRGPIVKRLRAKGNPLKRARDTEKSIYVIKKGSNRKTFGGNGGNPLIGRPRESRDCPLR